MTEQMVPYRINVGELARKKLYAGIPEDDVQLALAICAKYQLDPLLRHVVLVSGRAKEGDAWKTRYSVYITRDGLLSWAHETKIPFSITLGQPAKALNPYSCKDDIYLEGTLHRTGYPDYTAGLWFSEYVQSNAQGPIGAWRTHPAAMHGKVVEVYLLRRGFNVSLTPFEEIQSTLQGAVVEPVPDARPVAVDTVTGEIFTETTQSSAPQASAVKANGTRRFTSAEFTAFWSAAKDTGVIQAKAKELLDEHGGDPVAALDAMRRLEAVPAEAQQAGIA